MANLDDSLRLVYDGVLEYAKENLAEHGQAAVDDARAFVESIRDDYGKWLQQVEDGDLSKGDLEWLVEGKKDLAQMYALKQKGLAKAKIDEVVSATTALLVKTAVNAIA